MRWIMTLAILSAVALPAAAQQRTPTFNVTSRADCIANFRVADINRDGWLARWEVDRSPNVVPTQLLRYPAIDRQTYLGACRQLVIQRRP